VNKCDYLSKEVIEDLLKTWDEKFLFAGDKYWYLKDNFCIKYYNAQSGTTFNQCGKCPLYHLKGEHDPGCIKLFSHILDDEIIMETEIQSVTWREHDDDEENYSDASYEIGEINNWLRKQIKNKDNIFEF